jgi:hypothetical protein
MGGDGAYRLVGQSTFVGIGSDSVPSSGVVVKVVVIQSQSIVPSAVQRAAYAPGVSSALTVMVTFWKVTSSMVHSFQGDIEESC